MSTTTKASKPPLAALTCFDPAGRGNRAGGAGCAAHRREREARPGLARGNLRIAPGEHVAVIGPSGAGKTTLLNVLGCALPPSAGQMTIAGVAPWELATSKLQALRGSLFLAPQVPPLPPRQRVVTAVMAGRLPSMGFWESLRSLVYPSDIPAVFEALERFDLGDKLFDRVDRLSGGERQRVGLARALLSPARLWLIDEPLSALDPTRSRLAINTADRCVAGARDHARCDHASGGDGAIALPARHRSAQRSTRLRPACRRSDAGAAVTTLRPARRRTPWSTSRDQGTAPALNDIANPMGIICR